MMRSYWEGEGEGALLHNEIQHAHALKLPTRLTMCGLHILPTWKLDTHLTPTSCERCARLARWDVLATS